MVKFYQEQFHYYDHPANTTTFAWNK